MTDTATQKKIGELELRANELFQRSERDNSGGTRGFAINVMALTSSPADNVTTYFGALPKAPTTAPAVNKIYVRRNCIIKRAEIYISSGTAGTDEPWTLCVRVNNAIDFLIATVNVAAFDRVFSNDNMSVSLKGGDFFEIKMVNPTWVTNPLTTIIGGYVYLE